MPQVRMEPFGREFAELAQVCMSAGVWPSGKATAFGAVIRRFESYLPSLS